MNPRTPTAMYRSHVISWNLTKRCNLKCEHCYISAGKLSRDEALGELSTEECLRVIDQLCEVNPEALLILTGGEPLLRRDVFQIARYASDHGLWPVVGTNGVLITDKLCERMIEAGIRGVALSLDALDPEVHDEFRMVEGAFDNTVRGSRVLTAAGLPFIVQTTVGEHNLDELEHIARFAFDLGARVFNVYFLVPTGRGTWVTDVSPDQYEATMGVLRGLQKTYEGRMVVNSKCAPHYQRYLYEREPDSPYLKTFDQGAGGCPAGTHYLGIRPNGDVTPCPYLPVFGGNLRELSFREIWEGSAVFQRIRKRNELAGRCGPCEFSAVCGGCRARAYGASGDFLAEDAWCTYEPGAHGGELIDFAGRTRYGADTETSVVWTEEARARLKYVPGFVRGTVAAKVEAYARDNGLEVITPEVMHAARERGMGGRIANAPSFLRRMFDRS